VRRFHPRSARPGTIGAGAVAGSVTEALR
jgi:hypothetical protein